MAMKPKTIDEYLAQFENNTRAALEKLRRDIHAAAPEAEEYIGYGIAAFRFEGKPLVAIGATAKHCALYLMSTSVMDAFREELSGYDTGGGTIRFRKDTSLPPALVKKLVNARIAENAALRERSGNTSKPFARHSKKTSHSENL